MHGWARTALRLERLQVTPITVNASLQPTRNLTEGAAVMHQFLELLGPHANRIQRLEAILPCTEWVEDVLNFLEDKPFDALEAVNVGLMEIELISETVGRPANLAVFSRLRDLSLRGVQLAWPPADLGTFTFPRLTKLRVAASVADSFTHFLDMLAAMPRLQHLMIIDLDAGAATTIPQVTLGALEDITFTRVASTDIRSILRSIATPNLQSLSIDFPEPPDQSQILVQVVQTNSHIRRLDLTNCVMEKVNWDATFLGLPALTHLRIASSNLKNGHLRLLAGEAC